MTLNPGAWIEIDLEKPTAGGRMLGRHHGQVVLVWGGIPGERVRARVERVGKGLAYACTEAVLTPSADRRDAQPDWRCGGNVLAHVAYERQRQLKSEIIRDAFTRIARLPLERAPEVVASPESGYRMRARLHVRDGRIGFYREGTHELCPAASTGQLLPATNEWIAGAERFLQDSRLAGLTGIELAENVAADERACHLELQAGTDPAPFAPLAGGLVGLSARAGDRPAPDLLAGTPVVTDTLRIARPKSPIPHARTRGPNPDAQNLNPEQTGDERAVVRLRRDVRAFFQGNRYLLEPFVEHVLTLVPGGPVVDLYAGVGLFGLSLAVTGADAVTLVEGDPVSAADLAANAEPFSGRAVVLQRSVEDFVGLEIRKRDAQHLAATWIVDPPRTGMSKTALAGVVRLAPPRIVYVSCDVATLARDTRVLIDSGYTPGLVLAFDLFPNTAHVETVVAFTRQHPPGSVAPPRAGGQ